MMPPEPIIGPKGCGGQPLAVRSGTSTAIVDRSRRISGRSSLTGCRLGVWNNPPYDCVPIHGGDARGQIPALLYLAGGVLAAGPACARPLSAGMASSAAIPDRGYRGRRRIRAHLGVGDSARENPEGDCLASQPGRRYSIIG